MEGAFILCQRFHSVVATYVVNEDSTVVAGAGKDFVIVRMNGQPVDRFLVQEDIKGLAPATIKTTFFFHPAKLQEQIPCVRKDLTCANRGL